MEQNAVKDMDLMFERLKLDFKNSWDVKVELIPTNKEEVIIVYIEGMINRDLLNRDILTPIKAPSFEGNIIKSVVSSIKKSDNHDKFLLDILNGGLGIYYNKERFIADIKKFEKRSIDTPDAENVTRGPKEGFTEDLVTNTSLLRRKIHNANLVMESRILGRQTRTNVLVCYIEGLVNREVLASVRKRLDEIDCDAVLETGKIEQLMEKNPIVPINGVGLSQKPDIVASKIMEGRVCVICDGTPHVIYMPELFIENLQRAEDHYHRSFIASFMRFIRLIGFFISVILPGFYISIATFNPEMLPPFFLLSIITAMEKTPFPEAIEILFLVLMMELLKESGTRLPKTLGSAVSIVGALIIGEAAVNAGLVSAPSVIIVALSTVAGFIVPNLNEFITFYKILFILFGASMGLVGIGACMVIMLVQVSSIRSYGVPIMSFFHKTDLKDNIIRAPLKKLKYRPASIQKDNLRRMG